MKVDKIINNMVWKFNKELEYPKSIYRTNDSVILRDKDSAFLFGIKKDNINAMNRIQFAANNKQYESGFDALTYIINLYYTVYDNIIFVEPTLRIIPFLIREDGIMVNGCSPEARDVINDVGVSVYETIEMQWRKYMEDKKTEAKIQLAKREAKSQYDSKRTIADNIRMLLYRNQGKEELSSELQYKYANIELRAKIDFLYDENFDLMSIVRPQMDKLLYAKIKNTPLSKVFSNMVLVISIHEPSII